MWSGLFDRTCPNIQARRTRDIIGERVTQFWTIPWGTHNWWGRGKPAEALYEPLMNALKYPEVRHRPDENGQEEQDLE